MISNNSILLVDDDETVNFINKIVIAKSSLFNDILTFLTAKSCLEYLNKANEDINKLSGYIFLDINMPEMDGWQFLENFNGFDSKLKDQLEIYLLSSSQNPDDILRAEQHPLVKGFISKPLSVEMLKERFS